MNAGHLIVFLVLAYTMTKIHYAASKVAVLFIAAAFFSFASPRCHAGTLGASLVSVHDRGGLRTLTPGVYYSADSGASVGAFSNSYGRLSAWAGYRLGDRYAVTLGAVTGYPCCGVMPLVLPSVRFGGLRVSVVPRVLKAQTSAAVHLSWEFGR